MYRIFNLEINKPARITLRDAKTSLSPYYIVSANNIKPFEECLQDKDLGALLYLEDKQGRTKSKKKNRKVCFDQDDSNDAYLLTLELLQSSDEPAKTLAKTQDKKQGKSKPLRQEPSIESPSFKALSCEPVYAESDEESDKRGKKSKAKSKTNASASTFTFHATTRGNSGKASGGKNQCFFISLLDGMQRVPNAPKCVKELRTQATALIDKPNNDYQEQHEEQIRDFIVKGKSSGDKKSSKNKKSSGCGSGTIAGKNGAKINSDTSDFDCIEHGSTGIAIADHYGLTICIYGLFEGNQCNDPIYTFGMGRHIVNVALFTTQGHFEYITKLERNI
jgi:hypothetical protein